jgi:hypothetical protein
VNHFRQDDPYLRQSLLDDQILMHPFVIGEIACGNLSSRQKLLSDLRRLPSVIPAEQDEVLGFLDQNQLFGKGLTWVDAHLLASARFERLSFVDAGCAPFRRGQQTSPCLFGNQLARLY